MNKNIFITGTPTVGKTTVASELSSKIHGKLIKVNDFAIENDLVLGVDSEKGYKIIDIENLDLKLSETLDSIGGENIAIVEGHLSHFCSNADKVIVLRTNPSILRKRLVQRDYDESKILENLEAEALNICGSEAFEKYGKDVNEIDCSNLEISEIVDLIIAIINDQKEFPFGEVDFLSWIIENQ